MTEGRVQSEAEPDEECGFTYDHDTEDIYEDDEIVQWVCRNCGAEGWEDKADV